VNRTEVADQYTTSTDEGMERFEDEVSTFPPDISNMAACIADARNAILDRDRGPLVPDYFNLRSRLEAVRRHVPPLYQEAVHFPYVQFLDFYGADTINQILALQLNPINPPHVVIDVAQALLQQGEGYLEVQTDAFQEVISDLYDGYLSAADRGGVKRPDLGVTAPLVKWGYPDRGPYTFPADSTHSLGVHCGIVNLPPSHARGGLLGWAALPHELSGHGILHADLGLLNELRHKIYNALQPQFGHSLARYWSNRTDEAASDVLGVLNMGPAAGIGLIGYFRGMRSALGEGPVLSNVGLDRPDRPHPADIVRGYLAAATVRLLKFKGAQSWSETIKNETDKDVTWIRLGDNTVSKEAAWESCQIIATTIAQTKLHTLEGHSFTEIQNWRDEDELIVQQLRTALTTVRPLSLGAHIFATHVVAAAVVEALSRDGDIPLVFNRMIDILKTMHDSNPSWGPLFVRHPSDLAPHFAFDDLSGI